MTKEKPKRPRPFSYRPPQGKHEEFEKLVALSGLSINAFITECVFGRNRHRPAEMKMLGGILAQCARLADEHRDILHEIRLSGTDHNEILLEQVMEEIRLIRTEELSPIRMAVMYHLGRKS